MSTTRRTRIKIDLTAGRLNAATDTPGTAYVGNVVFMETDTGVFPKATKSVADCAITFDELEELAQDVLEARRIARRLRRRKASE